MLVYICSCFWQTLMDLMEQVSMGRVVTADRMPPPVHVHSHAGLNSSFVVFVLLCVFFGCVFVVVVVIVDRPCVLVLIQMRVAMFLLT